MIHFKVSYTEIGTEEPGIWLKNIYGQYLVNNGSYMVDIWLIYG